MRELQIVDAAELATAYAAAEYVVVLDGDALPLRVGEPASDLRGLFAGTALCLHHRLEPGLGAALGHRQPRPPTPCWSPSSMPSERPATPPGR